MNIGIFAALVLFSGVSPAVEPVVPPGAGHWEGEIRIQKKVVTVWVDLARDEAGKWAGSVEFPGHHLTATPFSAIRIQDGSVYLESRDLMLAIDAYLSPGGASIEGGFQSAFLLAIPVPVRLARVSAPKSAAACPSTAISPEFAGTWQGELKLASSWEPGDQRAASTATVRIKLSDGPGGGAAGTFQRVGDPELPITAIQQSSSQLRFEIKGAGVAYIAELKDHQLSGEWSQFDLDPVNLKLTRVGTQ